MPLPPAMLFPFEADETDVQVYVGACVFRGWGLANRDASNESGADIYDSAGADLVLVAPILLLADESTREWFEGNGILCRTGVLVRSNVGPIGGSLYLTPITNAEDQSFAFGESGPYFVHGGV